MKLILHHNKLFWTCNILIKNNLAFKKRPRFKIKINIECKYWTYKRLLTTKNILRKILRKFISCNFII